MKKKILALAFCLSCSAFAQEAKVAKSVEFIADGKYFSIVPPSGWGKTENITTGRVYKEYGGVFQGPEKNGAYSYMSFSYFGKDHGRFEDYKKYLKLNAYPDKDFNVPGEKYYTPKKAKLNGKEAYEFSKDTFEYIPPDAVSPKKVEVRVRKVVVPCSKGGFYVLELNSPLELYKQNNILFEKALKTFKQL